MKINKSINNVGNWIKFKVQETSSYIENTKKEINEKLELYLESPEYEEDLDELLMGIDCPHYKDKCFNHVQDRKERISLKEAQLKKKSGLVVIDGAIIAAVSVASKFPEPKTVICAAGVGAGTGAALISISTFKILYKRSLNGCEAKSHSPA
jgi:hypothetical protein